MKAIIDDELWKRIEPLLPRPKPRREKYPGRKPALQAVAAGARLIDDLDVPGLGLQALAQAVDFDLSGGDLAQRLKLAAIKGVGDGDRVLVDIQSDEQRAIVLHAGLRVGNKTFECWVRPHFTALALC